MDAHIAPAETAQAAPGVERLDVKAINRKQDRSLYAARQKVYPKLAHGRFRKLKWLTMAVTLGIYYALPWLRWYRGPDLPDQAVLLDMANNRFFFFFLEIWPQEFYFITGLLVLSALGLFLITSVAGRVWCGYTCPQTVWTDLMIVVERFWQGDRNARIALDKRPWGPVKLFRKGMTHLTWLAIGVATGGAFVFYFRDAPTLAYELVTGTAPAIAYLFLGIFTLTTYLLGGIAREQVCIYMCPWPRIQGAMVDHDTLLVSYHPHRGEPRGPHKKGQSWEGRGDCVDCRACVAVCPTGIDIRDGSQLECIQCALCIDACNEIMDRVGRPRNLIAYDTIAGQEAAAKGTSARWRPIRPRTMLYAGMICLVGLIMLAALARRSTLDINVLHDRNPPYVLLSEGGVRNGYTVKILNKLHQVREFTLEVRGLEGARLSILGVDAGGPIRVTTDDLRELRVFVTVPADWLARHKDHSTPFSLVVRDLQSGHETARTTQFQRPAGTVTREP
ncbi:MAG TPA: cytochrome c oxidase accessory protein CcoG [Hyphomicrobiaceae bacterium]|nr:cytochrome c oxidase accessory protein CcoG [Hyphomicrobiaceae bacterium]